MPRGQSPTHKLATWFWNEILEEGFVILGSPVDFWEAPSRHRNRYLGEAKNAIKQGLDLQVLKVCLRRLKASGKQPESLLLPGRWREGDRLMYDAVLEEKHTPPACYDYYALREWAETWGRTDIIKDFRL